jgi:hypothetical protein
LGGKWEEVKKKFPSPSIGHQAKNLLLHLPLATKQRTFSFTFHWPPSKEPSPSPSFFFSLKGGLGSLELFFFHGHNFQFNWENTRFHKFLEEEKDY